MHTRLFVPTQRINVQKTLLTFWLNASVFIKAKDLLTLIPLPSWRLKYLVETLHNCQGFPISKLVSELSFPFMQEPTEKQPLRINVLFNQALLITSVASLVPQLRQSNLECSHKCTVKSKMDLFGYYSCVIILPMLIPRMWLLVGGYWS